MKGPELSCCTEPSVLAPYASRAVIRHWVKEFGQVGDNFRETFHESSMCCPAAGLPVLALVHLSVLCFAEALAIASALLFLVSSPCGLSPVLLVALPLGVEGRDVIPISVFPSDQLFFRRVWPWGRAVRACLVSRQGSDGVKQLAQDFLFLLNVRVSSDLGDVLTLLGFV